MLAMMFAKKTIDASVEAVDKLSGEKKRREELERKNKELERRNKDLEFRDLSRRIQDSTERVRRESDDIELRRIRLKEGRYREDFARYMSYAHNSSDDYCYKCAYRVLEQICDLFNLSWNLVYANSIKQYLRDCYLHALSEKDSFRISYASHLRNLY